MIWMMMQHCDGEIVIMNSIRVIQLMNWSHGEFLGMFQCCLIANSSLLLQLPDE
jgi:hypothetical protein